MKLSWNVKNADTVYYAVSNLRHGIDCKETPKTRGATFGHVIAQKKALRTAMEELKALACDEYYLANGMADYNALCEKLFTIALRKGYVVLTFNHNAI